MVLQNPPFSRLILLFFYINGSFNVVFIAFAMQFNIFFNLTSHIISYVNMYRYKMQF